MLGKIYVCVNKFGEKALDPRRFQNINAVRHAEIGVDNVEVNGNNVPTFGFSLKGKVKCKACFAAAVASGKNDEFAHWWGKPPGGK